MEFDDILARGASAIEETVAAKTQEDLTLDFKGSASEKEALFNDRGQLTTAGRSAISKALSAFSNSAGGLLVIGVDARKGEDGIDCAQAVDPVPSYNAAISAIKGWIGQALQPAAEAIRVSGVPLRDDPEKGYIIIDVPRSERRPHMAQHDHRYYKRAGTSSIMMEAYDVEDAYRRFTAPKLELSPKLRMSDPGSLLIEFFLKNVSPVTALYPSLTISEMSALRYGVPAAHVIGVHRERTEREISSSGLTEFVVNPGTERMIDWIYVHRDNVEAMQQVEHPPQELVNFRYQISAMHMPINIGRAAISFRDAKDLLMANRRR